MRSSTLLCMLLGSSIPICLALFTVVTTRISNHLYMGPDDISSEINFAGVKFGPPIAQSLAHLGISDPSPIQKIAIAPLTSGLSAIIHAETGSGKTLAYVLPLLKRLFGNQNMEPMQAIILVPTKELAVQVALDIGNLVGSKGKYVDGIVHLCLTTSRSGLDNVIAPIIVGTPIKILDAYRQSTRRGTEDDVLKSVSYIALDEVDRLLSVPGRYATNEEKRDAREYKNPTAEFLGLVTKQRAPNDPAQLQVVAVSATVGRPLRRELYKIIFGSGESYGDFTILRPDQAQQGISEDSSTRKDFSDIEEIVGYDKSSQSSAASAQMGRLVGVPRSIKHVIVLSDDDSDRLTGKLVMAREMWAGLKDAQRALLFVPRPSDVQQAVGMLKFWGVEDVHDLRQALGVEPKRPEVPAIKSWSKSASRYRNSLQEKDGDDDEEQDSGDRERVSASEMLRFARKYQIGSSAIERRRADTSSDVTESHTLFVVPISGTRGLHVQDVEYIFLLSPPRTMDEYLHVAGRTGRAGNRKEGGTVVSFVTLDEMKRLQSWETALGISFDLRYGGKR